MPLKGILGLLLPFSLFSYPGHEVSSFAVTHALCHVLPTTMCYLATGPKAMGPMDCELKLLKPPAKITLRYLKVYFLRYFVTVMEG
jgi:hypothetical protein